MEKIKIIRQMEELKKMTTIKYLIFLVLQGFAYFSNAQSAVPCIEIDFIKTEYAIHDHITFNFSKNCEEKVLISISLEKKVNDNWVLFAEDIFQIPHIYKVKNVIILKENENYRKEKWKIKRTMYRKGCDNTYRFRYNIRQTNLELISTEYSNVFHVKEK